MKTNIKQLAFVFSGLAIITIVFLLTKSGNVEASDKNGKQFDDWSVQCNKEGPEDKKITVCLLTQLVNVTKDDKQEPLALYQLGYIGPKKELKMIQTMPLGIRIDAGTSIISSKKLIAPGKFSVCTQVGCQAVADISSSDLKTILNNNENSVVFMNIEGKQVVMPLSTKGLEEGLKFIK
jgi:invasion protein IalB